MRQLRMGLEVLSALSDFRMDHIGFISCIVSYRLDCISGSYGIVLIGSYRIVFGRIRKH